LWPAGVLPIAGATRVDAADIDFALGPAVAAAAGVAAGGFTTIEPPAWIEAVRKDPATLREMLAQHGETPVRPSVTELQRPLAHRATATGWRAKAKAGAPLSAAAATVGTPSGAAADDEDAVVNRRLGMIALGGAVAAGALMIALSFGRATPSVVAAEPFVPPAGPATKIIPQTADDTGGGSTNGGQGGAPTLGGGQTGGTTTGSTTGGSAVGGGAGGATGGGGTGTGGSGGGTGTGGSGGGTSTQGFRGTTSPSNPGGRSTTGGGGGQGGGAGQGGGQHGSSTPGHSGDHNPHGGPPGHAGHHGRGAAHQHASMHRHKH
jgi:hypothetical protein